MLPHASVYLNFDHGTCTSHTPQALRNAETHQPLAEYIRVRNQWTQSQYDSINWTALQYSIKRNNKKRIHYTKLVHDILPTNTVKFRHNIAAQKCPACTGCPQEDRDHIIRCSAHSRDCWRAETIMELELRCKQLHTDPGLAYVLVQGISLWMKGQDTLLPKDYSPKYQRLITQQNDIGWRQLFNGRMSTEWARLQDDYTYLKELRRSEENRGPRTKNTISNASRTRNGTQWTAEIIIVLWEQWYKVWVQRNAVIHGHDQATRARQQQKLDNQRLESIYQSKHLMEPSVQDLLFDTIDEHRQQRSHSTIHNWLSIHETTFIQSVKNVSKRAIQGVRSIKSFFPIQKHRDQQQEFPNSQQITSSRTPRTVRRQRTILSYFATGRPPETQRPPAGEYRASPQHPGLEVPTQHRPLHD